ncbi:myopalladin-like isoform X2 [Xyrauchen texanus]|uniref:myopalladin-like isoform X2 n=1 Tax=Xyrauchen texanus TaxID=154827 RepID=UPI002241941E|nr:myopalladin-like isoform X2 [Xyrauchen texanus]
MQENNMDQPTSLSQLLRESYLAEARAHHRHSESSCIDLPRRLVYGTLKEKMDDSGGKVEPHSPDLSAFLSQEELDKSVDLACKAISDDPRECEERPNGHPQVSHYNVPPETEMVLERPSIQPSIQDNTFGNIRTPKEPPPDFKRPLRNTPFGMETQSKKEFLNKAADFIEELSSLFKASSSKRIRPRTCKAHRSRCQNKGQLDGTPFTINTEDRERSIFNSQQLEEPTEFQQLEEPTEFQQLEEPIEFQQLEEPIEFQHLEEPTEFQQLEEPIEFQKQNNQFIEEPCYTEGPQEAEPRCEMECEAPVHIEPEKLEEPVCEPPCFIQKLKSREVPEGSKVQLDCIVRGIPAPEVRWFCEAKELENSPDIQIISNGERHSLIIAEAFEEDTGRYSCFASNFYGTDSTSAEIYIEGASSSDSDGEYLQAELQKRSSLPKPPATSAVSVAPNTSVEDSTPTITSSCPDQTAPLAVTEAAPPTQLTFDPPPKQEDLGLLGSEIVSSEIPELEPTISVLMQPTPISQPTPPTTPLAVAPPSPPSTQSISNILSTSQQSITENQNGSSSYLQDFDVRPIMAAPVFTKNLQDVLALEGQLVVLECRVKGIPSPKVDWYREGTLIEDSPDFRILQKKPRSLAESEEICTLVIAEVFPEDSGMFTCTASNKYGTVSSVAVLRVKGHNNNSIDSKTTSTLTVESSHEKVLAIDLRTLSSKCKPDVPLVNNKLHSSMICLDPLSSGSLQSDPLDTGALRNDSLNSFILHQDLATSLPSLNPLSTGKYHSDTFRCSLPQLDPLSFSSGLDPLNSVLNHKPLSSRTTHFDSGGSGLKASTEATPSPLNGLSSNITLSSEMDAWFEPSQNIQFGASTSVISPPPLKTSNHQENLPSKPLPDPPASCLKTKPEGVLVDHNEPRSCSRVGLRVTFKLPEDEEENDKSNLSSKDPPPVLAKPKLDPVQLQILHNQVILEQQQESVSPSQESPLLDKTISEPQSVTTIHPPTNSVVSQLRTPSLVMNSHPIPQMITGPVPLLPAAPAPILKHVPISQQNMAVPNSIPFPQLSPSAPTLHNNPPIPQNLVPATLLNTLPSSVFLSTLITQSTVAPTAHLLNMGSISSVPQLNVASGANVTPMPSVMPTTPIIQPTAAPNMHMPQPNFRSTIAMPQPHVGHTIPLPQLIASTTQPNTNHMASMPPITPSTHVSQINMTPTLQMNSVPINGIDKTVAKTQQLVTPDSTTVSSTAAKLCTTSFTHPNVPPLLIQDTNSKRMSYAPLSNVSSPHLMSNPPAPIPSPVSPPPLNTTLPPLPSKFPISTQSFSYTRPKEFIAAQTLSPLRSPSPTESPVPMLHELAAQIFPKSTRELMSPVNQFTPSPKKLPTRVLKSPSSPPAYVSSPPLFPPGLVNSVFAFRTQSPPQASSPTSSSSTPSPIQNPVAFLSSVLPSLPTSPLTNAMGLPKSAPLRPQGALQKNQRAPRPMSEYDIRDSRETLLQDIERKLQNKDEPLRFGQQEYKVSSFEQRLLSEIEFRLERTPVEESDDDVQHDAIPTGKCIAPIFERKLKHFRAMEGVPVTFTCKVVGIPVPKVYWFKDGKQILKKNDHYKKIREGDGTCSLHIQATTSDDDGNYTVMAANPQGRISCSGHLIVQTGPVRNRPMVHSQRVRARVQEVEGEPVQERFFRPHFLQAPGDMLAHEGQLCRLDCKVSGLPHPEIMWLLNGRPIYPDVTHRMLVRENGVHSLVIDPLTQADDGTYTCIASNKAGQCSFCLELKVVEKEMKQAPHFVEKLQNTGIAEGAPVRLECRVLGMPQPLIYWKKDNDTISHSKDRISMHQDTTGYVCLLIQPTRKEDAGWYTVSAKNEAGIISCTARLDIYAQWHQHVHPPMKKTQLTGSFYAALTGQGLDIMSAFPTGDNGPVTFTAPQSKPTTECEEL